MKLKFLIWIAITSMSTAAYAQRPIDPQEKVVYRQAVYNVIGWHWSTVAAMMKNQKDYNAEKFIQDVTIIDALCELPIHGFSPDTKSITKTKARPEIWENWNDFSEKMIDMKKNTGQLLLDAKSGNQDNIKVSFLAAAKSCKSCHDKYRDK